VFLAFVSSAISLCMDGISLRRESKVVEASIRSSVADAGEKF